MIGCNLVRVLTCHNGAGFEFDLVVVLLPGWRPPPDGWSRVKPEDIASRAVGDDGAGRRVIRRDSPSDRHRAALRRLRPRPWSAGEALLTADLPF